MIATPPQHDPNLIIYVMDPHVDRAVWLLIIAIMVIAAGYAIDVLIAAHRKNKDR